VIRVHPQDGSQVLLAGGGSFQLLRDVEIDPTAAGSFLVVDSTARKVFRVDATIPFDVANPGSNQTPWAACPEFVQPRGIAVEASGSVLVADLSAKKVFRINPTPVPRVCTALAECTRIINSDEYAPSVLTSTDGETA
jgi:streptogramin lyase